MTEIEFGKDGNSGLLTAEGYPNEKNQIKTRYVDSAVVLKQLELIADGETAYSVGFDNENSSDFCGEFELGDEVAWCHVKVKIREEWKRNGHSGHWLMEEGCALYSNPIFFRSESN